MANDKFKAYELNKGSNVTRIVCHLFNTVIHFAGSEDLTGNICYLYSRFYALQVFLRVLFCM